MQEYRIRYQKGFDIFVEKVKAHNKEEAMYLFYMNNRNTDILEIKEEEVEEDGIDWFY